MLYPFIVQE